MPTPTIYGGETDEDIYHLLVTGSRDWDRPKAVEAAIKSVMDWCEEEGLELHIVHGGCKSGADLHADEAAQKLELPCHRYPAPWNRIRRLGLGRPKSAGVRRNAEMPKRHDIDGAIAFHENIDDSTGTADMIEILEELEIEYRLID